jgi:hypothetical protein
MPLFQLELVHDNNLIAEIGEPQEFADLAEAREEAVKDLREVAAEYTKNGKPFDHVRINIVGPDGARCQITTAEAVHS